MLDLEVSNVTDVNFFLGLIAAARADEGLINCTTVIKPEPLLAVFKAVTFTEARNGVDVSPQKVNGVRYTVALGDMNNGYRAAMTDGKVLTYTDEINHVSVKCVKR